MLAHQRLRTDHGYQLEDRRKPAIELGEEQAIGAAKLNAAVHLASKDDELMPERCILGFEPTLRLERAANSFRARRISAITAANLMRFSHWFNTDGVFGSDPSSDMVEVIEAIPASAQ